MTGDTAPAPGMRAPRQVPVREWTCSQHDYPQECEECGHNPCDECARSTWRTVGYRDASPIEEMLYALRPPILPPSVLAGALFEFESGASLPGSKVTIPLLDRDPGDETDAE